MLAIPRRLLLDVEEPVRQILSRHLFNCLLLPQLNPAVDKPALAFIPRRWQARTLHDQIQVGPSVRWTPLQRRYLSHGAVELQLGLLERIDDRLVEGSRRIREGSRRKLDRLFTSRNKAHIFIKNQLKIP